MIAKKDQSQAIPTHLGPGSYLRGLKLKRAGCKLPIRSLNACQVRKKTIDPQTVERYRELLYTTEPPPIVVIVDTQGRYYIADGHHRVAAALAAGRTAIRADLYRGDSRNARLAGLEANQHGLGRENGGTSHPLSVPSGQSRRPAGTGRAHARGVPGPCAGSCRGNHRG